MAKTRRILAAALLALAAPLAAQTTSFYTNTDGTISQSHVMLCPSTGGRTTACTSSATYTLASNLTSLAATTGTTPIAAVAGGTYVLAAQFTGTSVVLQALGPNGTTWLNVATLNASGTLGVVVGTNATLRLYNPNGSAVTAVYAGLS